MTRRRNPSTIDCSPEKVMQKNVPSSSEPPSKTMGLVAACRLLFGIATRGLVVEHSEEIVDLTRYLGEQGWDALAKCAAQLPPLRATRNRREFESVREATTLTC